MRIAARSPLPTKTPRPAARAAADVPPLAPAPSPSTPQRGTFAHPDHPRVVATGAVVGGLGVAGGVACLLIPGAAPLAAIGLAVALGGLFIAQWGIDDTFNL